MLLLNKIYRIDNDVYQGGLPDSPLPAELTAVLTLCVENFPTPAHVGFHVYAPIFDGPYPGHEWLHATVTMVEALVQAGHRVYVHCLAGISRSVMVTLAYLMKKNGWDLTTAQEWVKAENATMDPSPGFLQGLKEYEAKLARRG